MKIGLIILLAVAIFAFFATRTKTPDPETEERNRLSKEKYNELIREEKLQEVLAVVDATKGDINNVTLLRDAYDLNLLDAKNLWEHVKPIAKPMIVGPSDFSDLREIVDRSQGDIANIKIIKDYYQVDLKTAKELWDTIRDEE